jgi:hypothetical protein
MVILVIALSAMQLIAAFRLAQVARREKGAILWWLAASFGVAAIMYMVGWVIAPLFPGGKDWRVLLAVSGEAASAIFSLFFTHAAFYQDRSSPRWVLLVLVVLAALGVIVFDVQNRQANLGEAERAFYQVGMTMLIGLAKLLAWGWHFGAAWRSYRRIAASPYVEDWVKARYQLILGYSLALVLGGLILLASPLIGFNMANNLTGLTLILTVIPQFLAWAMPEGLRRYLNRNYQPPALEDELAAIVQE